MAERHQLTTEERRRGAYAAAAAKRAKRARAENLAAELRAQRMVSRREAAYRNWSRADVLEPIPREPTPSVHGEDVEPQSAGCPPEERCPHGIHVLSCECCNGSSLREGARTWECSAE